MLKPNWKYFPQQPTSGSCRKCWCLPGIVVAARQPGNRSLEAGPSLRGPPWAGSRPGPGPAAARLRLCSTTEKSPSGRRPAEDRPSIRLNIPGAQSSRAPPLCLIPPPSGSASPLECAFGARLWVCLTLPTVPSGPRPIQAHHPKSRPSPLPDSAPGDLSRPDSAALAAAVLRIPQMLAGL